MGKSCVIVCWAMLAAGVVARAERDPALVAWYLLDEGRGQVAADASRHKHHGRIHGARWVRDEFGTVLEFDGLNDYVDFGGDPAFDVENVTVAAWVLPKSPGGGIVSRFTGGGWHDQRLVLSYATWGGGKDLLWVLANPGHVARIRSDPPPAGEWTHVAATADGKRLCLYLNGKLAAEGDRGGVVPLTKGVPLKIGVSAGLGAAHFRGLIDDVKIYSRALSADEILAQYRAQRESRKAPVMGERIVTFEAARDTVLDSEHPPYNYGAATKLSVGRDALGPEARVLLRFDLSRVPATSLVVSAKLRLFLEDVEAESLKLGASRMHAKWNEGLKAGARASALEPTWAFQLCDEVPWAWESDCAPYPESVVHISKGAKPGWCDFDITHMATDWVADPVGNAGVLLRQEGEASDVRKTFASRECEQADRRPTLVLVYQPPLFESTEAAGGAPRLVVGISKAMPLVNTAVTLRAKAPGWKDGVLSFSFTDYPVNFPGKPARIGELTAAPGEKLVEQPWTPAKNGLHNILVEAKQNGQSRFRVWLRVPVLAREMTFYGGYRERRYVNLLCSDNYKDYPYWKARGVLCLGWAVGTQANLRGRKTSPEEYLTSWEAGRKKYSRGADGIMIDEMFGTPEDANCAEAIRRYKKQFPERLICPYTTGVGKEAAGTFKDCADLVMIESYAYSPRAYRARFDSRLGSAVKYGLAAKSIASICAGDNYVTTEPEIRRQARYVRRISPTEMPGVSIYSGIRNQALIPLFDKAIEDYWLGPVLLVKSGKGAVTIQNIGQTNVPPLTATIFDFGDGTFSFESGSTSDLRAQGPATKRPLPKGARDVRVETASPWAHVIYDNEDFAALPEGKTQPFTLKPIAETFSENFDTPPELTVSKNKDGFVEWGHLDVTASRERSFTLSFDITFESIAIYAGIDIQAGTKADGRTKNVMGLGVARTDDDRHIRTGRAHFSYTRKEGERYRSTVHTTMMRPIELEKTYRFFMHYEKASHVRAVAKLDGKTEWDTGPLTIGDNTLGMDELRFRVRPYKASSLTSENGGLRMKLGDRVTGGWTNALVDNVQIRYMVE